MSDHVLQLPQHATGRAIGFADLESNNKNRTPGHERALLRTETGRASIAPGAADRTLFRTDTGRISIASQESTTVTRRPTRDFRAAVNVDFRTVCKRAAFRIYKAHCLSQPRSQPFKSIMNQNLSGKEQQKVVRIPSASLIPR